MHKPLQQLTGFRAYLAIWVVLYHADKYFSPSLYKGNFYTLLHPFLAKGYLAVDVFFILSGFILVYGYQDRMQSLRDYRSMLWSRLARLYPIYAVTLILAFIVRYLISHNLNYAVHNLSALQVIVNIPMLQNWSILAPFKSLNFISWSVSCEWFAAVFLVPLLLFWLYQLKPYTKLVLSAGLLILLTCYASFFHFTNNLFDMHMGLNSLVRVFAEFTIGGLAYYIYQHWQKGLQKKSALLFIAGTIALLTSCIIPYTDWLIVPASMMLIFALANNNYLGTTLMNNHIAKLLGSASYSLYLAQGVSYFVIKKYFMLGLFQDIYSLSAFFIITTITVGLLLYFCIEKPMRQWLKSINFSTKRQIIKFPKWFITKKKPSKLQPQQLTNVHSR